MTQAILPGNWFHSRDIAHTNEENHIVIKGWIKDCISRGTRKIIHGSIEDIVITMHGIQNVVAIGVPDKPLYEEVCICYVIVPGHDISPTDVKQFCIENFIGQDAIDGLGEMPKYFIRFDSLPKLMNGKINKRQLRLDATQQLRRSDQMD
jgi:acyl-CoA synthetase (AMP-forming)/AMP-acid ligase II